MKDNSNTKDLPITIMPFTFRDNIFYLFNKNLVFKSIIDIFNRHRTNALYGKRTYPDVYINKVKNRYIHVYIGDVNIIVLISKEKNLHVSIESI